MLRHQDITDQGEFILATDAGKFPDEEILSTCRLQKGEPTITTEGDEVQMATTPLHVALLSRDDILILGALL